jgi:hypothetical protein
LPGRYSFAFGGHVTGQVVLNVKDREDFDVELVVTFTASLESELYAYGERWVTEYYLDFNIINLSATISGSLYKPTKQDRSAWDNAIVAAISEEIA